MPRLIVLGLLHVLASFAIAADQLPVGASEEPTAQQTTAKLISTTGEARSLADQVMGNISSGEVGRAMDLLAPHFPVSPDQRLALFNRISRARVLASQRFGAVVGHQFVKEEKAEDTLVRFTYIEKHETNFVRWSVTFYKPKDAWIFYTISWDGDLDALLS